MPLVSEREGRILLDQGALRYDSSEAIYACSTLVWCTGVYYMQLFKLQTLNLFYKLSADITVSRVDEKFCIALRKTKVIPLAYAVQCSIKYPCECFLINYHVHGNGIRE